MTSASNPGEIFPMLRWIGCNGLEKKLAIHSRKTDEFMQGLLDQHRRGKRQNTMVDHLLSLQESQPEYYTDEIITGLIVVSPFFLSLSLSHVTINKIIFQLLIKWGMNCVLLIELVKT